MGKKNVKAIYAISQADQDQDAGGAFMCRCRHCGELQPLDQFAASRSTIRHLGFGRREHRAICNACRREVKRQQRAGQLTPKARAAATAAMRRKSA